MALLNYTTTVDAQKTIVEIQNLLVKAGAKRVMVEYDARKMPATLVFELHEETYQLPCRSAAIDKLLRDDTSLKRGLRNEEQALRVGWRIVKTWLMAQLAIIEAGMVSLDEVMLPYALVRPGKTMYQVYREERPDRLLEKK